MNCIAKRRQTSRKVTKLSLISMIDFFTILVFFLMVNSGDVEVLQTPPGITLPQSQTQQRPPDTLKLLVTNAEITLGEQRVAISNNTARLQAELGELLKQSLLRTEKNLTTANSSVAEKGFSLTLMADKDVPYHLLKQILAICASYNYRDVALAVNSHEAP